MIRLPLFGKDSSPQYTSVFISAISTFVIWLIMILVFCFVPLKNKNQKYEVVQIVLDSKEEDSLEFVDGTEKLESEEFVNQQNENNIENTIAEENVEIVENVENKQVDSKVVETNVKEIIEEIVDVEQKVEEQVIEKIVEEKVIEKIIEKPEKIEKKETSNEGAKNQPEPIKKNEIEKKSEETPLEKQVHYELVKSNEELLAEQNANQKKKNYDDFDWDSMFGETEEDTINKNTNDIAENRVNNTSTLSGNAGNVTEQKNHQQKSESSSEKNITENDVTSSTKKSLEKIEKVGNSDDTVHDNKKSDENKEIYDLPGNIKLQMNGSLRKIVKPENPELKLSAEAQKSIENDIMVKVSFNIQKNGHVLENEISFDRKSLLTAIIQKEIKEQICSWVFEQSDEISKASFDYFIKIRR